jgi:RAT1-interacting protein
MTAPYEDRDTMNLNLMLVGGTMYLEEHLSDAQLVQKNEMNPRQREQTYFGYSFEAWSTQNKPPGSGSSNGNGNAKAPVWGGDVNTNEQWCVVVKTRLGSERLVIRGEVDCVKGLSSSFPSVMSIQHG